MGDFILLAAGVRWVSATPDEMPDLPDFLDARGRAPAPRTNVITKARPWRPEHIRYDLPRSIEAAGLEIIREQERDARRADAARDKARKERREAARRQMAHVRAAKKSRTQS